LFKGDVPDDFVRVLLSTYRNHTVTGCEDSKKAFEYFVNRILPAVNANHTRYHAKKKKKLLSEIFTVTDEAFGLMLLENYEERWRKQHREPDKKKWRQKSMNAKYTASINGVKTNTWSTDGMNKFCEWCNQVQELREDYTTGRRVEEQLLLMHNPVAKEVGDVDSSTVETDVDVYIDSAYESLFGVIGREAAVWQHKNSSHLRNN
jgi:L-rhamnose mutarotase